MPLDTVRDRRLIDGVFRRVPHWLIAVIALVCGGAARGESARGDFLSSFDTAEETFVNDVFGAGIFYAAGYFGATTIVANIEAGHIWFGHEVFNHPEAFPPEFFTYDNPFALNEADLHATLVGHVLAGTGYIEGTDPPQLSIAGIGMAPLASVWSGAIATEFAADDLGAFATTPAAVLNVYEAFFTGIGDEKPDVINSSWGGPDPAAASAEAIAVDGLARENPTVALVAAAGNHGAAPAGWPGSGYNNITVGSVGGANFLTPSSFTSSGAVDFYDPVNDVTREGARAAVDIAAPGESLFLAAYLGPTGGLAAWDDPEAAALIQDPSSANLYFVSVDGTSFAAPIVAGGIALLKDVSNGGYYWNPEELTAAEDTRVIKSVLMASAKETEGWDNGQEVVDGVIVTDQALDYATGAGAMDLNMAIPVYLDGTKDVAGTGGGLIDAKGWDFASLAPGDSNEYVFLGEFAGEVELAISLNWFAGRSYDEDAGLGVDLSFANLDLEIWRYNDPHAPDLIAQSISLYNNTEFLRLTLDGADFYGITVKFAGMIYGAEESVEYGLAWRATAVPEPTTAALAVGGLVVLLLRRRVAWPGNSRRLGGRS